MTQRQTPQPTPTQAPTQTPLEKNDPKMQGEGNYTAARRYDKAQQDFVKSGQVEEAAREAAPKGPAGGRDAEAGRSERPLEGAALSAPLTCASAVLPSRAWPPRPPGAGRGPPPPAHAPPRAAADR
jgi:hypothetical protein